MAEVKITDDSLASLKDKVVVVTGTAPFKSYDSMIALIQHLITQYNPLS